MRNTSSVMDDPSAQVADLAQLDSVMDGVGTLAPAEVRPANRSLQSFNPAVKRLLDVVIAVSLIAVLLPLWIAIAVAIRLDSAGPILFRQLRVGQNGRGFGLLKFRTMHNGADLMRDDLRHLSASTELFKIERDPRVTKVGRFLRATSLDEAPQLLHVLSGRMSLVGPRPLVPDEDARVAPQFRDRLSVRPGLTGPWQIAGPDRHSLAHMAELDSDYIRNWSVATDLKLIARTIGHVLTLRGF